MKILTPKELTSLLETSPETIDLIDVRRDEEYQEVHIPEARHIPLDILPFRIGEIDMNRKIIFICRSGIRSGKACELMPSGVEGHNLIGGMIDFEKEFPKKVIHGEKKKLF